MSIGTLHNVRHRGDHPDPPHRLRVARSPTASSKKSIQDETGIKPEWAAESFNDLDEDVRQSVNRIKASPFIPKKDSVRGFVFDVATGKLNEVSV